MKYIVRPSISNATRQELVELLKAVKYVNDAFEDFGSEGYYDADEQEKMDSERQEALDRLKHATSKIEFILRLDRAMKDKEVKA